MTRTLWNTGSVSVLRAGAFFLIATALAIFLGGASPAMAQSGVDLTGETCLGSTASIDPDGEGPLPAATYCVMIGRLGSNQALELDDIDGLNPISGNADSVADANLFSGPTSNDPDLPAVPGATYIDWADLPITALTGPGAAPLGSVENHRILDFTANNDFNILRPQSASCLNDGSALPKEDFTQSYIANNEEFLYFAQERRTNNGNSVYYWLLTKHPVIVVETGDCGLNNTRGQVQFNLSAGDVELLVNFPDSSDPAGGGIFFRSYSGSDTGYIPARDAVFHSGWGALAPVLNISVNIAQPPHDGDDSFGPWGGISSQGNPVASGSYTTASLAEWAVDLSDVFGSQPLCGQRLFITGLSRASTGQVGSLTEPSALKDIVGPKLYSFGEITASAELTPSCDLTFGYSASAVGLDGVTPLDPANLTASWSCTDEDGRGVTLSDDSALSGTGTIPRGDGSPDLVTCTVTVTDTLSGCDDDAEASTTVLAPILVSIAPDNNTLSCTVPGAPGSDSGNIGPGVTFMPGISGGDGNYTLNWGVVGPNAAVCAINAQSCTVDIPDADYCARTNVNLSVDDGSPLCPAKVSETESVTKMTVVNATNN